MFGVGFLLKLIYSLLIFSYISMRLVRDSIIVFIVGQEATSLAKFVSLIVIFGFIFFQNYLIKRFEINKIIKYGSIIFSISLFATYFKIIPTNSIILSNCPLIINKLINNLPTLLFYIISELFAVFIVTNFWLICNHIIKQHKDIGDTIYNQMFMMAQCGILIACGLSLLINNNIIILVILIILTISYFINYLPTVRVESKKEKLEIKSLFKQEILLVPVITCVCGMIAGTVDPYVKLQLRKISDTQTLYLGRLAKIWILQSATCMIFSEIFKFEFVLKRFITPLFLVVAISILMILKLNIGIFHYAIFCSLVIILFKNFKYSMHSPYKEKYIKNSIYMNEILIFEGFAGRFGKNLIAIILSMLFSFGYTWIDLENSALNFSIILSFLWLVLSFNMK